jgi:predicted lipoprotein with Yx(FWY)xxD motif
VKYPHPMKLRRKMTLAIAAVSLLAIGLAACGSSNNSSSSTTAAATGTTASAGGATVATKSISGVGTVLVDSKGNALYTNNMDTGSKVACTGECTAIWPPLTSASGSQPTSSDSSVQAKLGVVKGGQVTYGGKPLYTFVQDSPGQATGNGVMDSFGGTNFTWTAATVSGQAGSGGAAPTTTSSSSSGSSGGGGGYGY